MELPEELTVELLGLVLDREVKESIGLDVFDNNILHYLIDDGYAYTTKDTLARWMKEWCRDSDYYLLSYISQLGGVCEVLTEFNEKVFDTCKLHCKTEFEAVLKSTEWVAKEKGLLK